MHSRNIVVIPGTFSHCFHRKYQFECRFQQYKTSKQRVVQIMKHVTVHCSFAGPKMIPGVSQKVYRLALRLFHNVRRWETAH